MSEPGNTKIKDAGGDIADVVGYCLAHRRLVRWIPAPGWWIHQDYRTCAALWSCQSPHGYTTNQRLARVRTEIRHLDGNPRNLEVSNLELRNTEGSGQ